MRYYKRNTTNLVSMILSIFILFGIIAAVPGVYSNPLISYCVVLAAFFIFMPLFNAAIQNIAVTRAYDPQKYFFTLKFNESAIYEWVVCGSAVVLLYFLPNTDLRPLGWTTALSVSAIWFLVSMGTTSLSQKWTRIDFMSDSILVRGVNFYKSSGLSQKTTTGLGIYTYDEFEGFTLNGDKLSLRLLDGRGQVSVQLPQEKSVQITQYLMAKGVARTEAKLR